MGVIAPRICTGHSMLCPYECPVINDGLLRIYLNGCLAGGGIGFFAVGHLRSDADEMLAGFKDELLACLCDAFHDALGTGRHWDRKQHDAILRAAGNIVHVELLDTAFRNGRGAGGREIEIVVELHGERMLRGWRLRRSRSRHADHRRHYKKNRESKKCAKDGEPLRHRFSARRFPFPSTRAASRALVP